mmetsp:Transcript_37828/g.112955  ORF Transcript_37828/g.112955 Transcript_37828/m.112955 type:complete len:505 (+) Transcript_37828:137-1651(+)
MIAKLTVHHRGGDVFDISQEPSDRCVLWGELVKEKERRFLKSSLREQLICFSVRDTFQISIRTIWRPESVNAKGIIYRKGRFAMLLHDTSGRLTTSWSWLKLVMPLYQNGISAILVDLPGLGKSSINDVATLDPSVWQDQEAHILCHILDELQVARCHVVACGSSCSAFFRIVKNSPRQLEKTHILHNPVLDYSDLFKDTLRGPAPGMGPKWRDIVRAEQQQEVESILVNSELRVLATFDQAERARTRDTHESLLMARRQIVLSKAVTVLEVRKEDICEAQIGAHVPVSFLFLSKEMRERYMAALQLRPGLSPLLAMNAPSSVASPDVPANALSSDMASGSGEAFRTAGGGRGPREGAASPGMSMSRSAGSLEGFSFSRTAQGDTTGSSAWPFAPVGKDSSWMDRGGMTSPSRAFTSEGAKEESLKRLVGDPRLQRQRLLSMLPSRTRLSIKSRALDMGNAMLDAEPATEEQEREMLRIAMKRSKQSLSDDMAARKTQRNFTGR